MKNTFDPYTWHNSLYFRWTALPVMAHVFSWMTGWAGIVLFPVLVTVAQYLILKVHPAIARPGAWFFTLPITFFIWLKWGPFISYAQPNGILYSIVAYYAGQLINALFIPLIIKEERPGFLLNWIGINAVAAVVWITLYELITTVWPNDKVNSAGEFALFIIYPAIGLVANGISGFFLKYTDSQ